MEAADCFDLQSIGYKLDNVPLQIKHKGDFLEYNIALVCLVNSTRFWQLK